MLGKNVLGMEPKHDVAGTHLRFQQKEQAGIRTLPACFVWRELRAPHPRFTSG